jgi:DNA-binding CsgD family transcriptional regulator
MPSVVAAKFEDLVGGGRRAGRRHRGGDREARAGRRTAQFRHAEGTGATACLSKETEGRDVINAIHLASRGMHVLPRSAAASGGPDSAAVAGAELLTPREAELLQLLQDGRTNAQIAHELSIGIETVRTHARNIYRKLGVGSRRELARLTRGGSIVEGDGKNVGTRHRDEGHRGEHGAAREGLEEAGLAGRAGKPSAQGSD